eukprot:2517717-Amphidinium_carterae.1
MSFESTKVGVPLLSEAVVVAADMLPLGADVVPLCESSAGALLWTAPNNSVANVVLYVAHWSELSSRPTSLT